MDSPTRNSKDKMAEGSPRRDADVEAIASSSAKQAADLSSEKTNSIAESDDGDKEHDAKVEKGKDGETSNCSNKENECKEDEKAIAARKNSLQPDVKLDESDESVTKETQSLEKRISSLLATKETVKVGETVEDDGASRDEKEKEGKRKRRNPSIQERGSSTDDDGGGTTKRKRLRNVSDKYCWRCHKESREARCSACPRSWHRKCMGGSPPALIENWICGECATILRAENAETRPAVMAQLSIDQLCLLLKHVVARMRECPGSEPFWKAVDLTDVPNYLDYVVKPMDLGLLETNVRAKLYGSTDAFMADAKWIQHNCVVFNTGGGEYDDTSKLTNTARQVIKAARQEVSEIEACPDCYGHARNLPRPQPSWFIEPCRIPHTLVWAKLKGFPYWPAKAMPRVNGQGHVDVRFFGAHDRAWVSPRDLYLYSEDPPAPLPRKRKMDMDDCVKEITRHCKKLELAFGKFNFAPPKVPYNPQDPMQIKIMLPNYDPLHPSTCVQSQVFSPKRKTPTKKRSPPVRKKLSAGESSLDDTAPDSPKGLATSKLDSSDDIEKCIEFSTIPKITSTPLSKADHTASPFLAKTNGNEGLSRKEERRITSSARSWSPGQRRGSKTMIVKRNDVKLKKDKNLSNSLNQAANNENFKELPEKPSNKKDESRSLGRKRKHSEDSLSRRESAKGESIKEARAEEKKSHSKNSAPSKGASPAESSTNNVKTSVKANKNQVNKVYKPKTRMVNQVIAERAMESVADKDRITRIEDKELNSRVVATSSSDNGIVSTVSSAVSTTSSPVLPVTINNSIRNVSDIARNNCATTVSPISTSSAGDQPLAFFLLAKNGATEAGQKPASADGVQASADSLTIVKQEPKDQAPGTQKKATSKARKSLPNKPPLFPQIAQCTPPKTPSSSPDAMVYIPAHRNENGIAYQLPPPEAGPLSSQLHRGAHELARRMAQLMEEALRETAQNNLNSPGDKADSRQATIHFLRLQIERMRWQHQQQLAELKHNTDLTLREMRASLEAERQRAVEEVRRESEEEKVRSVEETKRKQWCALCGNEALFYCCWNTAYCDYPCQQAHWPTHMRTCAQNPPPNAIISSTTTTSNTQQQNSSNNKACSPAGRVYALQNGKYRMVSTSSPCGLQALPIKALKIHQH